MSPPEHCFCYARPVSYYETDAMGVVHHSNFLRIFEDARVAWIRDVGLGAAHFPAVPVHWAVIETKVKHLKPAYFGGELKTFLQVKRDGLKIFMQYATYNENKDHLIALGETVLVPVGEDHQPVKLPGEVRKVLEKEIWTETWL